MCNIKQSDVILVNFDGTSGHEQRGYRPAIVVSSDDINKCGMCVVVPISNQTIGPNRVQVPVGDTDTTGCALTMHLRTIDVISRRPKKVGRMPKDFMVGLLTKVKENFNNV